MKLGVKLNPKSHTPLAVQICDRIRRLVNTGRLPAGELLPSVRAAADDWGVNFTTVARAYQTLKAEGLICQNKSRRMIVCVDVKTMSERERAKMLSPLIAALKAQARELRLTDAALRAEIVRVLKWDA